MGDLQHGATGAPLEEGAGERVGDAHVEAVPGLAVLVEPAPDGGLHARLAGGIARAEGARDSMNHAAVAHLLVEGDLQRGAVGQAGDADYGVLDVAADAGRAWVSWLERGGGLALRGGARRERKQTGDCQKQSTAHANLGKIPLQHDSLLNLGARIRERQLQGNTIFVLLGGRVGHQSAARALRAATLRASSPGWSTGVSAMKAQWAKRGSCSRRRKGAAPMVPWPMCW